jgi:F-type H+-transporting ATPase subunit gamma
LQRIGSITETPLPEQTGPLVEFIYEPSPREILNAVVPRFTEVLMYEAFLEARASEQSARMVAMRAATDNANDLIGDLTLTYNQARQNAITKEMLDIVGGVEALSASK